MEPPNTQQTTRKGIHIDYINKTIKWWSIYEDDWAINPFNALWPGWTLHSKGDNYEWHENITGYKMRDGSARKVAHFGSWPSMER